MKVILIKIVIKIQYNKIQYKNNIIIYNYNRFFFRADISVYRIPMQIPYLHFSRQNITDNVFSRVVKGFIKSRIVQQKESSERGCGE